MEKESIDKLKQARLYAEKEKHLYRKRLSQLNQGLFTKDELMLLLKGLSMCYQPSTVNEVIELKEKIWSMIKWL